MKKNIIISLIVIAVIVGVTYAFTNKKEINDVPEVQGKIDINAVCEGALAYMSFPDGDSAAVFVEECKEGKHPEVIENYKKQMNLGDGAAI